MTASERQTRIFNGALQLLLHRNGQNAKVWGGFYGVPGTERDEIAFCVDFAKELEAKVESALKGEI